jgi:NAD(P)-dependent dehydrogenase (short-subunit alcohol dehydrogenase family)
VLAAEVLRPGLLEGTFVLVAGTTEPVAALGVAVSEACTELGAHVQMCAPDVCAPDVAAEVIVDELVIAAVAEGGSPNLLVVDGAGLFAHGIADSGDARAALRTCLDATWNVTRAVVNLAFLGAEPSSSDRPGSGSATRRIVYLAPASAAGEHAGAARAGLENLARTLSIEWARHGITLVTIAPGEATAAGEVAALAAYLASPAGAYFSGCLLDLRGP